VALCEAGFSTPSSASESVPAETRATTYETENAPSWVFQWRSLQGQEENFLIFLACLVPILINILFILVKYSYRRRVSYETQQKLSDPRILFQKGVSFMGELRVALESMQNLEERRGQFQNEMDSMKDIMKVEDERHERLQNGMDLIKKMLEVDEERQDQFQNETFRMKTMMNQEERRRVQFLKQMDAMRTLVKAAERHRAVLQNKVETMKKMMKEDDEHLVQLMTGVDSMKRNGATQFSWEFSFVRDTVEKKLVTRLQL
jgi:hypothetical protein